MVSSHLGAGGLEEGFEGIIICSEGGSARSAVCLVKSHSPQSLSSSTSLVITRQTLLTSSPPENGPDDTQRLEHDAGILGSREDGGLVYQFVRHIPILMAASGSKYSEV